MANKTIFDLSPDLTVATGNWLVEWDSRTNTTKKILVNSLVALSPQQAAAIPLSGSLIGATNIGTGIGFIVSGIQTGVLMAKTLKAGSNITLTNQNDSVVINAADAPLIPVQSGLNVGPSGATIFKQLNNYNLEFKNLVGGSGIALVNGTGSVTINFTGTVNSTGTSFTGIAYQMVRGGGNSFNIPYGGDGTTQPTYTPVSFGAGSPSLITPAGNNTIMFDWLFGFTRGSLSAGMWYKLVNTTASSDLTSPTYVDFTNFPGGFRVDKQILTINGSITVKPYILHSGTDDTLNKFPQIVSTGSSFSYLKIS